jgi:hypothetical protein
MLYIFEKIVTYCSEVRKIIALATSSTVPIL